MKLTTQIAEEDTIYYFDAKDDPDPQPHRMLRLGMVHTGTHQRRSVYLYENETKEPKFEVQRFIEQRDGPTWTPRHQKRPLEFGWFDRVLEFFVKQIKWIYLDHPQSVDLEDVVPQR